MVQSSYKNPLDNFVAHGVKTVSSYQYILLVDEKGQAVIERVASDSSTIMFCKMARPPAEVDTFTEQADAIDDFWTSPETKTYQYLFQC